MKMGFVWTGVFWGSILVLLGLSVLLKAFFNIDLPFFRVIFGLFFIYLGFQIMTGGRHGKDQSCDAVFQETKITPDGTTREHNVIFGKGNIDLTGIEVKDKTVEIKINTIFGDSILHLNPAVPTLVKASAAFGALRLPDGNMQAMGSLIYKTKSYVEGEPCLALEVNTVFGNTVVEEANLGHQKP